MKKWRKVICAVGREGGWEGREVRALYVRGWHSCAAAPRIVPHRPAICPVTYPPSVLQIMVAAHGAQVSHLRVERGGGWEEGDAPGRHEAKRQALAQSQR